MSDERLVVLLRPRLRSDRRAILAAARAEGFRSFAGREPPRDRRAFEQWFLDGPSGLRPVGALREPSVRWTDVGSPRQLRTALAASRRGEAFGLRWTGDRVIPLESALASRPPGRSIWVLARSPREVPAALGALEAGADRVVVAVRRPSEARELRGLVGSSELPTVGWGWARVESVTPVGVSERVLVDTTSLLAREEGLLLGSTASRLVLVTSESEGSAFSGPRAFRVNAGAPHMYLLMSDGSTRYLSELCAGDRVLVARPGGADRSVIVGRLKIERRPLVLVRFAHAGQIGTAFVQEAETVRFQGRRGRLPVTALRAGALIRCAVMPKARHLGRTVEEAIEER